MKKTLLALILALILVPVVSGTEQFRGDTGHSGTYDIDSSAVDGTVEWIYRTQETVESTPVIGPDGTIYFGAGYNDGYFHAIDQDGNRKWRFHAGWMVSSSPALDDNGIIYFGITCRTDDIGYFMALYPNGSVKWDFETRNWVVASPLIMEDGRIVFGCQDGYIYCLDKNGSLQWEFHTLYRVWSTPCSDASGNIYFTSGMYLFSLDGNGTERWQVKLDQSDTSSPMIYQQEFVVIADSTGAVRCLDLNGELSWKIELGYGTISDPAILSNGSFVIATSSHYHIASPVVDKKGNIYFGSGRCMYGLYPNGSLKWNISVNGACSEPVIGPDGRIFIGTHNGLVAIGNEDKMWPYVQMDDFIGPYSEYGAELVCIGSNGEILWNYSTEDIPIDESELYFESKDVGLDLPVLIIFFIPTVIILTIMRSKKKRSQIVILTIARGV